MLRMSTPHITIAHQMRRKYMAASFDFTVSSFNSFIFQIFGGEFVVFRFSLSLFRFIFFSFLFSIVAVEFGNFSFLTLHIPSTHHSIDWWCTLHIGASSNHRKQHTHKKSHSEQIYSDAVWNMFHISSSNVRSIYHKFSQVRKKKISNEEEEEE